MNAATLLLGVGYQSCTALHLAEYWYTDDPPLWSYACVVTVNGRRYWREYQDAALDDRSFPAIGDFLDKQGAAARGQVGQADCRLVPLRHTVDAAANWLAEYRAYG
jgi:aminoglycoside 3-N-acetyltransferase